MLGTMVESLDSKYPVVLGMIKAVTISLAKVVIPI